MELLDEPIANLCRTCVVIPAKNEEARIEQCLHALINQIDLSGQRLDPRSFEIMLLVNNSQDDTAKVARKFAQRHKCYTIHVLELELSSENAHVGFVRRYLMDEAQRRLQGNGFTRSCIATTDADTMVNKTWLAATLRALDMGADGVAGRIFLQRDYFKGDLRKVAQCYQWLTGYRQMLAYAEGLLAPVECDPNPRHNQHGGASLAITAAFYKKIGGLTPVAFEEDVALYHSIRNAGGRFRHCPSVCVRTSARPEGRVQKGLSSDSHRWRKAGQDPLSQQVEQCEITLERFRAIAAVRNLWYSKQFFNKFVDERKRLGIDRGVCDSISQSLACPGLDGAWLQHALERAVHVEQIIVEIEQHIPLNDVCQSEPLSLAIEKLGQFLNGISGNSKTIGVRTNLISILDASHKQSA